MATPNLTTQSPRFRARCAELASEHHLLGTCNWRGVGDGGRDVLTVPSASQVAPHIVTWDARTDRIVCDCKAASYGNPCGHIGAAADYVTRYLRTASSDRAGQRASLDPAVYEFHGWAYVRDNNPHEWAGARAELEAFGLPTVDLAPAETAECVDCGVELPVADLIEIDMGPDGESVRICAGCEWAWEMRMDREPMPYDAAV